MFAPKTMLALVVVALVTACAPPTAVPSDQASPAASSPSATPALPQTRLPQEQPIELPTAIPDETTDASGCPALDSHLAQIVASPSPIEAAKQMGAQVKDDKVQVLLLLRQPDTAFLIFYGADIGSSSGDTVQAYVPIAKLCELAKNGQVLAVKLPAMAVTQ